METSFLRFGPPCIVSGLTQALFSPRFLLGFGGLRTHYLSGVCVCVCASLCIPRPEKPSFRSVQMAVRDPFLTSPLWPIWPYGIILLCRADEPTWPVGRGPPGLVEMKPRTLGDDSEVRLHLAFPEGSHLAQPMPVGIGDERGRCRALRFSA